jgi:S-formylglutathione hydrolase FrmB
VFGSQVLDAPLIAGVLPTAVTAAGAVGGVYLLVGTTRRWWARSVPLAVLGGVAFAAVAAAAVAVLRPFPDPLPLRLLGWIAVVLTACVLAAHGLRRGWTRRILAVVSLLAVLVTGLVKANAFYGYRPTLAALIGVPAANEINLADLPAAPLLAAAPHQPLAALWHAPPGMPRTGRISQVALPGTRSHFAARPAWVYLPPAYLASPRARLPVLVLIAGQPGGPEDWLLAGRLATVMDAFAATHDGLAPVVVVPDATGSSLGNTLCMDSRLGEAETYLAEDVPAWTRANLQIDPSNLAVGGFSFGGTCALQLALRRPDVYPTFLDISGQARPTLGDDTQTVQEAFGGDEGAFDRVDPLHELETSHYPDTAGVFAAGRDDPDYRPQAEQLATAARAAGIPATLHELPGGHSWAIASTALTDTLPWLGARTDLLEPNAAAPNAAAPT